MSLPVTRTWRTFAAVVAAAVLGPLLTGCSHVHVVDLSPAAAAAGSETEPVFPPAPAPTVEPIAGGPSAPVLTRIATTQPVVFLTIDDGWVRDPAVLGVLRAARVPVTLFLVDDAVTGHVAYFRALQAAGATVEDHTLDHPHLSKLSYDEQREEICRPLAHFRSHFGATPRLFRPPYGDRNRATLRAARSCGAVAVVQWDAVMVGGELRLRATHLRSGDIILLHFHRRLAADLVALLRYIRDAGMTVGSLESYLGLPA